MERTKDAEQALDDLGELFTDYAKLEPIARGLAIRAQNAADDLKTVEEDIQAILNQYGEKFLGGKSRMSLANGSLKAVKTSKLKKPDAKEALKRAKALSGELKKAANAAITETEIKKTEIKIDDKLIKENPDLMKALGFEEVQNTSFSYAVMPLTEAA